MIEPYYTLELLDLLFDENFALVTAPTRAQAFRNVRNVRNGDRLFEILVHEICVSSGECHYGTSYRYGGVRGVRPRKSEARRVSEILDAHWGYYRRDGELPFIVAYDVENVIDAITAELARFDLPPVKNPGIDLAEVSKLLWPGEPSDLESLLRRCVHPDEEVRWLSAEFQHELTMQSLRVIERRVRNANA